ncbi:hypothetical protein TIFTF001_006569 [Ficus carica]|uniref:Uncharacterized protein n=1 Tax=Ficus carica TaxID=3494 RepID=A0AA87ZNC5_FICCA|nr:hypothetical protein TIFTF001_006569 [Ficus carica]
MVVGDVDLSKAAADWGWRVLRHGLQWFYNWPVGSKETQRRIALRNLVVMWSTYGSFCPSLRRWRGVTSEANP